MSHSMLYDVFVHEYTRTVVITTEFLLIYFKGKFLYNYNYGKMKQKKHCYG